MVRVRLGVQHLYGLGFGVALRSMNRYPLTRNMSAVRAMNLMRVLVAVER